MTTLLSCQPPPPSGYVTILEHECQFVCVPDDHQDREEGSRGDSAHGGWPSALQATHHRLMAVAGIQTYYPDIEVNCEQDTTYLSSVSLRDTMFLPVPNENPWKRAWNTWRDNGIISALKEVASPQEGASIEGLPSTVATYILTYIDKIQTLKGALSPRSQMSTAELVNTYSQHSHWDQSPIRAIALHPRLPFIAIGRQDNLLEIKALSQSEHSIFLKDKSQVGIICLEWAPHCNNLLAVGASTGVLLWNVDPTASTTRFLTSWVRVETSPGHAPITSLSWSPHGNFLVSASPADNSLITWDIPMGVATRVKRAKGGGLNQVLWSPDSQKVFAASVESVFRVWETQNWTCEKWTNFCGRCKAACWSPKGDVLIFALEDDPSLYYLSFRGYELAAGSTSAIKCADLAPCNVTTTDGEQIVVGGNVQSLAWDPTGERLAVIFTPDSPSANLVAVLRTRTSHMLEIIHGGFIRGREGESPSLITFKTNYNEGALLATVWSGSRVSFTPLSFQASSSLSPFSYPEQLAAADVAKFQQQQPHLSGPAHPGSGRSTPLQPLGRARLREHMATPLYSTQT